MTFIQTVPEEEADGQLSELYAADRELRGYLPNYTQAFSARPDVYAAWRGLVGALTSRMDARRYELATLAAARRLRSSYCSLAHGSVLLNRFLGAEDLRAVASDHRSAGLEEVDVAVMDLAEKVAGDATAVSEADVERLRELGLTDGEIFEVVAAAAMRCFFAKTLDGLGVCPDAAYGQLAPELRAELVVGRPIEEA
jgi:uncharacterized peroxidase-related enzyme